MSDIYFVLNGYLNGDAGVRALPAGGGDDPVQSDGWYFLLPGDADGRGPYPTRDAAEAAHRAEPAWYAVYLDGPSWERVPEASGEGDGDAIARVDYVPGSGGTGGYYRVSMEGGYDALRLEVSAPGADRALRVFAAALSEADEFQG